jgi:hypothetical protein
MIKEHKTPLNLIFLFTFLLASLIFNYLHTETSIYSNNKCPACHFQNSTFITAQINIFILPQLTFLETLKTYETFYLNDIFLVTPSSRSPPYA